MNKKVMLSLMAGAMVFSLVGCGKEAEKKVEEKVKQEEVVFATAPDGPPFTYKENGKLTGFDVELINEIAEKENMKVSWKEMKFNGIIPALQSQQVDGAVAAITIRDDRKEVVNFTDPYFESGLVLVTKTDSTIKSLEDLKGKTIVAKQGSSGLEKANELAKEYGAKVKVLEDEPTLYMDVQKGGADALVNDYPFVMSKLKLDSINDLQIVGEKLTGEEYGIAITKENEELLKTFNEHLTEMKENGEYDAIYEEYFGTEK